MICRILFLIYPFPFIWKLLIVFLDFLLKGITEAPAEQARIYCRRDLLTLRAEGFLWKDQIQSFQATLCLQQAGMPHIAQKSPSWMLRRWGWRRSGLSLPFLWQGGFSTISSQKTAHLGLSSSCSSARNVCSAGECKCGKQRFQQLNI